jgi:hypothetical protein
VSDDTGSLKSGSQRELPLENGQRSWAKRNPTVVSGLGLIAVNSRNPGLVAHIVSPPVNKSLEKMG